ncbi:MAG: hypothetical protein K9M81_01560 [Chthoniobacterales bacterium]|nr:hypothetical protein [Chthoniobacterales bacterium]
MLHQPSRHLATNQYEISGARESNLEFFYSWSHVLPLLAKSRIPATLSK